MDLPSLDDGSRCRHLAGSRRSMGPWRTPGPRRAAAGGCQRRLPLRVHIPGAPYARSAAASLRQARCPMPTHRPSPRSSRLAKNLVTQRHMCAVQVANPRMRELPVPVHMHYLPDAEFFYLRVARGSKGSRTQGPSGRRLQVSRHTARPYRTTLASRRGSPRYVLLSLCRTSHSAWARECLADDPIARVRAVVVVAACDRTPVERRHAPDLHHDRRLLGLGNGERGNLLVFARGTHSVCHPTARTL